MIYQNFQILNFIFYLPFLTEQFEHTNADNYLLVIIQIGTVKNVSNQIQVNGRITYKNLNNTLE